MATNVENPATRSAAPDIPAKAPKMTAPETSPLESGAPPPVRAKTMSRGKWLILTAILLVLTAAGLVTYLRTAGDVEYLTARVDRGDIDATVVTTGNCNAVISVQVGSQVSGNIIALYADFNTQVKQGQLVARIDPAPFQAAVDQSTASLNAAKAAAVTAQASFNKSQSDLATAVANLASQKANVVKAQSAVELARLETERRKILVKEESTSQEDLDTAQASYDQAVASLAATQAAVTAAEEMVNSAKAGIAVAQTQVDQAAAIVHQDEAVLRQAQLNLNHTEIRAPVDGTVVSRNMDVGQTVAASFQAPTIFLIAQDLKKMQVDTNVDEADVGPIRLGQPANFTVDAYPGQIFPGKVSQIREAPINVQNVITYDVVVQVANPDLKLFPGMTANATIFTGRASNALRVPKAALRFHPHGTEAPRAQPMGGSGAKQMGSHPAEQLQTVYVLAGGGQLKPVRVKLGLSDANYAEVSSGDLVQGQPVVVGIATMPGSPGAPAQGAGSSGTKKLGF